MLITIGSKLICAFVIYILIASSVLAIAVYLHEKAKGSIGRDDFAAVFIIAFTWPVSVPVTAGLLVGSIPRILRDRKTRSEQEDQPPSC